MEEEEEEEEEEEGDPHSFDTNVLGGHQTERVTEMWWFWESLRYSYWPDQHRLRIRLHTVRLKSTPLNRPW